MDGDASGPASAAGETSGEENIPSSPIDSDNSEENLEEEDDDGEEDGEEDVDIINVSDDEEKSAVEGEMEVDITNSDQEIDYLHDYMKESPESESNEEESSESEEGKKSGIFHNLPPNFPSEFTKLIADPESTRPRILIEKKLRKSDVDQDRNRLMISAKKMKEVFLLPEEEERLKVGEVMSVALIEPNGESVSSVTLRRRRGIREGRAPSYVFTGEWNQVVARNENALKRRGIVRVWYFRVNGGRGLWFAIQVLEEGKEEGYCEVNELAEKWRRHNVFAP